VVSPTDRTTRSDGALRLLAFLVAFHALVQIACAASSAFGVDLGRGRAIGSLAVSVLLAAWFAARFREPAPDARDAPARDVARVLVAAAWLGAGAVWVSLLALAWARPPYDWDGLYYHLPAIHEWVRLGHVAWIAGLPDVPFVNYPMGVEAHTFLLHQAFPTTRLVNACNLWYWPMAFVAVVVTAGRLGARGPWRWLAGGLLVSAPVFASQSVTCYVDVGFAACVMAAVAASVGVVFGETRADRWDVLLWGAALGLVAGAKGTGVPMCGMLVAAVLAGGLLRHGRRSWRGWMVRAAAATAVALVVGGSWYARNLVHTGNPIHPIELRIGHLLVAEGYDFRAFSEANLPAFLEPYPGWLRPFVSWLQLDAPIRGEAPVGGLGFLWLLAGLPATIGVTAQALRDRGRGPAAPILFTAAVVALLLAVQTSLWWARFTVWLDVLALPCLALALQRTAAAGSRIRRGLALLGAIAAVGIALGETARTVALERETGRVSGDYLSTMDYLFPGLARAEGFDRMLEAPRLARSGWSREGTLLGGALAMPLGRREIRVLPDVPSDAELRALRGSGVEWVLWDVLGAGEVPESLRGMAVEGYTWNPSPEVDFRALRLSPPAE